VASLRESDAAESVRLALEFTILCATRTSETLNAVWDEIDTNGRTWTIPASRMKAGVAHRIPLSNRAIEILERAKALRDGGDYVFPGRTAKMPLSNMAFLMALRRMKRDDITTHGFRSSFRDWTAERTNFPRAACESALAHTLRDKTEAAYNRTDLFDRRRELMSAWATFATTKPANVLTLRAETA
jgi:integrase